MLLDPEMRYRRATENNMLNAEGVLKYRQAIGWLLYLADGTRSDLTFVITYMNQFNSCLILDWCAVYIVFPEADQKFKTEF